MIFLVRHGQSANNALPEHQRVCDPGLTALGVKQAESAAAHLAELPITHIYCSPFLRALETARPIAQAKNLPVHVHPDIFEQGGCYSGYAAVGRKGEPGMGADRLRRDYPDWYIDPSIPDTGWWNRDYESYQEAQLRAERVATWLREQLVPEGGLRVFVIHADFKQLLIETLFNDEASSLLIEAPLFNTGITHVERSDSAWRLLRFNCVNHLQTEMVSPKVD